MPLQLFRINARLRRQPKLGGQHRLHTYRLFPEINLAGITRKFQQKEAVPVGGGGTKAK
jgi:hypothetical protein